MNLHENKEEFDELIALVAEHMGIPADAVRRDYYIVKMLQNREASRDFSRVRLHYLSQLFTAIGE